ncbi:MAG: TetR family transcriptional regulator C-terminal domain-containing protein [Gemmatimonadales bacterium]
MSATAARTTKTRLLDAGWAMLLARGYHGLGVQAVLDATGVPKGSFYHHFEDKEDFALQVVDRYMADVHAGLDRCLGEEALPPLDRVRRFFEQTERAYREEGYLGCLLGGLGQELAGASAVFREKIDGCLTSIAGRIAACLGEAKAAGQLPAGSDPVWLASVLVDCWEGAALRSRLSRSPAPLLAMLDFYFDQGLGGTADRPTHRGGTERAREAP